MDLNEYQILANRTIDYAHLSPKDIEYHALHGMTSELGELNSIYQKKYQGHRDSDIHKKKELGDLLWFISEYCTAKGWWLEDIAAMNIEKLIKRYPNGFESDKSIHRKEGDI